MPKRGKRNSIEKRNKSLKKAAELMKDEAIQNAFAEYEAMKKVLIEANDRIKELKRHRYYLAATAGALLVVSAVDVYLLYVAYRIF